MAQHSFTPVHELHYRAMRGSEVTIDSIGLQFDGRYVMFSAEQPLMRRHAQMLCQGRQDFDVLEIGFGLGIFFREACKCRPRSYTVIEAHPVVCIHAMELARAHSAHCSRVQVLNDLWETALPSLGRFDAVMSDTCSPQTQKDNDFEVLATQLAEHHLWPNGSFSFFQNGLLPNKRMTVLQRLFKHIAVEEMEIELPTQWTKPSSKFTIVTASI